VNNFRLSILVSFSVSFLVLGKLGFWNK